MILSCTNDIKNYYDRIEHFMTMAHMNRVDKVCTSGCHGYIVVTSLADNRAGLGGAFGHDNNNYNRKSYSKSINIEVSSSISYISSSFWTLKKVWYTASIRNCPSFPFLAFKSA